MNGFTWLAGKKKTFASEMINHVLIVLMVKNKQIQLIDNIYK